ncbi:MAG TPA: AraC family transcriptional regulator [Acidobacteriota bacterium]|nr:AraC family transcriptional regulator [Acidobacteriota bacterium]
MKLKYGVMNKKPGIDHELLVRLSRARQFMDDCYGHELDLQAIAREASYSPYHFLRLFRRTFHETPHQYLIRRRIEKAKELLSTTHLSVTAVCFEVGFQSLGSFSWLFHRVVGRPPLDFRSKMFQPVRVFRGPIIIPECFRIMFGFSRNFSNF